MYRVLQGERPDRPPSGFSDPLWEVLESCWFTEQGTRPSRRPSTSVILDRLREDVRIWKPIIPWEDDLIVFLSGCKAGTKGKLEREQAQEFADKLDSVRPLESERIWSSDYISRLLTKYTCSRENENSI
jgi:hypothetical protein